MVNEKILLTSSGFETERILEIFHSLLQKPSFDIKALFLPTAANNPRGIGIEVLPKCLNDLLKAGISRENITIFDLHRNMKYEELQSYDVVYFTGGSPQYLIQRINDTGFHDSLHQYIDHGGIYVGVSAGSIIATNSIPRGLGLINCTLSVHRPIGTANGVIEVSGNPHIDLSDQSVLLITDEKVEVAS